MTPQELQTLSNEIVMGLMNRDDVNFVNVYKNHIIYWDYYLTINFSNLNDLSKEISIFTLKDKTTITLNRKELTAEQLKKELGL